MEDIFGDEDIDLARMQIRETLGSDEEYAPAEELPLTTEDADSEEIIAADFTE